MELILRVYNYKMSRAFSRPCTFHCFVSRGCCEDIITKLITKSREQALAISDFIHYVKTEDDNRDEMKYFGHSQCLKVVVTSKWIHSWQLANGGGW